jgi:hypothetical protein
VQNINPKARTPKRYWHNGNDCQGYMHVNIGKVKKIHRLMAQAFIENFSEDLQVDHINGIRSDNRLENLRMVTHRENCQNRDCHRNGRLIGVYFNKKKGGWRSEIHYLGKRINLGYFKTEVEASNAYKDAILDLSKIKDIKSTYAQKRESLGRLKGTTYDKKSKKWKAVIYFNSKRKNLGSFETEQEAHDRYLEAKKELGK